MAGRTAPDPIRPFRLDFTPLRQLRRVRELSQEELARAAGVHWSTVHRLENNKNPNPSGKAIIALSRALGVPMYQLFSIIEDR